MNQSIEEIMKIAENQERLDHQVQEMSKQMGIMSEKVSDVCLSIERLVVTFQESTKSSTKDSERQRADISDNKLRIRELESHKVRQETLNKFMYAVATASMTALVGVVVEFLTR